MTKKSNVSFHDFYENKDNDFLDIVYGLRDKKQKTLSSKFFYDERGSLLFEKITTTKDYYPTLKEMEILEKQKDEFFNLFPAHSTVIEFGSGSNKKIKKLLKALNKPSEYIPIDISKEFLFKNALESAKDFPNIKIKAVCADFDQIEVLENLMNKKESRIGFFPGSTIGNYKPKEAKILLKKFSKILGSNNFLIVGVDLKKDIDVIERAYNDTEGITASFNKNIVNVINEKCGSLIDSKEFYHKAFFNENESRVEMHLVSKRKQVIKILGSEISFYKGESIHTENSYKYSVNSFKDLLESQKFEVIKVLTDKKSFFGIFFLKVKNT